MKIYVIITLNLCTIHGANMYIYNKVQYLKEQNYSVFVYSAESGEVVIPGLREYQQYQNPYLRFYPGCFNEKRVAQFITEVCNKIDAANAEEIIVESTNIYSALWGELLAKRLNCKHLTIILQERFGYSEAEREFLRFKLERHELAGINKLAVSRMLENDKLPFNDSMYVVAHCNNTIDQCEDEISPKLNPGAALTIGSIGRLEKKYVLPLAKQLKEYCNANTNSSYNIVFIGGTREAKQIQRIRNIFAECSNVNLVLPGMQFPIPKTFVEQCDLFISAAGSAWATYYMKRPTIFLNPSTGDIIGIPGLTCKEGDFTIYTANSLITEIGSMIDLLLKNRDKIQYTDIMKDGSYQKTMRDEFERQLNFTKLCSNYNYYNTYMIHFTEKSYRPFNVLGKVFSARFLYKGLSIAQSHLK